MELRQTKALGTLYHHNGGVWNIYTYLDYGCGNQNVGSSRCKQLHVMCFVFVFLFAVDHSSDVFRSFELFYYVHVTILQVLVVHLFTLLYEGVNNEDLSPFFDLLFHEGVNPFPLSIVGMDGFYWFATGREFVNDRYIQVPVKGHSQCPGNRGGCHHKYMGQGFTFVPQPGPLLHPKTVLFVNNSQTQVTKLYGILNKGMGAKEYMDTTIVKAGSNCLAFLFLCTACEQGCLYTDSLQQFERAFVVLPRKHLGGCHDA
ncbi:hypothetical protein SDC9_76812 [bioreactor metagenome]|uniref:Uncharacterized protein n=1 Tax=bioreactor metagenome TaxID=1076179 RepID=A0A644YW66_9ZZZZ